MTCALDASSRAPQAGWVSALGTRMPGNSESTEPFIADKGKTIIMPSPAMNMVRKMIATPLPKSERHDMGAFARAGALSLPDR